MNYTYGLPYVVHISTKWSFCLVLQSYCCMVFVRSRLDHCKFNLLLSQVSHCANIADSALHSQTAPIFEQMYDDQLFPATAYFAYFLIFTCCVCTNKLLYANFPHPSYRNIQPSLFKQATHFNVMFFSFLIYFFTVFFVPRGIVFSWQVLLYLLGRIAEALVIWPWDTLSSGTFRPRQPYCTLCEIHFLTHSSSIYTHAWEPSRH